MVFSNRYKRSLFLMVTINLEYTFNLIFVENPIAKIETKSASQDLSFKSSHTLHCMLPAVKEVLSFHQPSKKRKTFEKYILPTKL
jgi:hypothetical protein